MYVGFRFNSNIEMWRSGRHKTANDYPIAKTNTVKCKLNFINRPRIAKMPVSFRISIHPAFTQCDEECDKKIKRQ